jgi:M6 family metalloprotease-like protein
MIRSARPSPLIALQAFLCGFLLLPAIALAGPPRPALETLRQPDGTPIVVKQFGDEWGNGIRTRDGYTILRDERTRFWKYAEPDPAGGLRHSPLIVGRDRPVGISPRLSLRPQRASSQTGSSTQQAAPDLSAAANLGSQPLLVILVDFTPSVRIGSTAATLYSKFFGSSGSVKDYYEKVSYGNFSLTPAPDTDVTLSGLINDGIVSVTLPYAHPNPGSTVDDRNRTIVRDALLAADPYVDFSQFDTDGNGVISATELHIIVIVAGAERSYSASPCAASVWAHRWGLSGTVPAPTLDGKIVGRSYAQFGEWHCSGSPSSGHAATIGVMVHELGHDIGLPDLYDTDDSSAGIGDWSVMASGSWNGITLPGDSPAHFDPWSKFFEGWMNPTIVTTTLVNQSIVRSATNADFYQLLPGTPTSGEYFLVENRQRANYDAGLPGSGLLLWHIDASKPNNNSECYPGGPSCVVSHYKVALVQADNQFNLEKYQNLGDAGDPWPGTAGNTTFNDSSGPGSNLYSGASSGISVSAISAPAATMTATLAGIDTTPPDTSISGAPLAVTNLTTATFTFSATEANSSFTCQLDSGVFSACTSPKNYSGLVSGSHTFRVQATDLAGNTDPTPASYNWTVDLTAPDTSITSGPTGTITTGSATFEWTGSDNLTAPGNLVYAYRLNPIEPSYSAFGAATTASYASLAPGAYTFYVKAKDEAANEDGSPAALSFTVAVDTTPPDTNITSAPPALSNSAAAIFNFTATEAGSTFQCSLDGGLFTNCSSPQSYLALASGSHAFRVRATDAASNTDLTPASYNWTIDLAAPDTSITGGPTGTISANSATFNWTGTDNLTAPANLVYAYRLDPIEPSYSNFSSATAVSYNNLTGGNYTFYVKSRDQAGNEDLVPASQPFTVSVPGPLRLGTTSLPQGEVGVSYSVTLGVSGGQPSYAIAAISGALPGGLSLVGQNIVGTPAAAGKLKFTLSVTDQSGVSVSRKYTLTINKALTISSSTLKSGTAGRGYKVSLKASGGKKNYSWSWLSEPLPGLSLSPNGRITGTPATPGTYNPAFQVTDPLGGVAQKTISLTIR